MKLIPLSKGQFARIQADGKRVSIGYFHSAKEAGEAYVEASLKVHGQFAVNQEKQNANSIASSLSVIGIGTSGHQQDF